MTRFCMLLLCFALAACNTPDAGLHNNTASTNPASVQCNGFSATAIDDKAMLAAETVYNIPANAYVTLNNAGKLSADVKATAKPLLIKLAALLGDVRTAYSVGDACTFTAKIAAMQEIKAQVQAALPAAN